VYHVLNRAAGRTRIFRSQRGFEAFERASLPERPDYEKANRFVVQTRRFAVEADDVAR
jgi:hypothetical protein